MSSGNFGNQDAPQANERCAAEYCENGVWYNCACMCTNDLCPAFGVYYSAASTGEDCIDGACCDGASLKCICILCDSASDCPACSNKVNPECRDGRCRCEPCTSNDNCISGYCCKYTIDTTNRECVSKGTIYNYGGKSYLCDPPEWTTRQTTKTFSLLKLVWDFLINLFKI